MESTIQKSINTTTREDGAIVIEYKPSPRAMGILGKAFLGFIALWVLAAFVKIIVLVVSLILPGIIGWGLELVAFAAAAWYMWKGWNKWITPTVIQIVSKPNEFLQFDSNVVPWSDIQTIGTVTNVNLNTGVLYLVSHGTRVNVTKVLNLSLVDALADTIRRNSGRTWE